MIQRNTIFKFLGLLLFVVSLACSGGQKKVQHEESSEQVASSPKIEINDKAKSLLKTLEEKGDYVNSRNFPSMIKASTVKEEMGGNNLIIDLRSEETYADGHIENAVNVSFYDLPEYFENEIDPQSYDKIVLTCYAGQMSSYATSLLRLAGYDNVYAMRWGMSSWNPEFATYWFDHVSSDYQDGLEHGENEQHTVGDFPTLDVLGATGDEILKERIDSLFEQGFGEVMISAETVFEDPANYYVINYDRKDKYESGHVPGAIRYKPGATLGIVSEMQTIPADKEVVVYCNTGQNSSFAVAYLRLFGYNVKTLTYGTNSFMHERMKEQLDSLSWILFTKEEVHDYPYVKN